MSVDKQHGNLLMKNSLERAAKALLNSGKLPEHKRPDPTKEELEKRYVMRTNRNGKPTIKEVV